MRRPERRRTVKQDRGEARVRCLTPRGTVQPWRRFRVTYSSSVSTVKLLFCTLKTESPLRFSGQGDFLKQ